MEDEVGGVVAALRDDVLNGERWGLNMPVLVEGRDVSLGACIDLAFGWLASSAQV